MRSLTAGEKATAQFISATLAGKYGLKEAARRAGAHGSQIWRWMHGYTSPAPWRFRQLQAAYEQFKEEERATNEQ